MTSTDLKLGLRRALYPLYRNLESSVHPLRYLFIEITQRCNLDCLHCGSDCGKETQLDELTTGEWLRFFEYLAAHFDKRKMILVITGGEPLCHPEFGRITTTLKKLGLAWGMVTNGFSLTKAKLQKLIDNGLISVTISLDGLQASHDWLRGRHGAFKHAVQSIQLVTAQNLPFFDIVTCVNPRNLPELPEVEALLRDLGVPAWRLFSIFPKGRAKANGELILSGQQTQEMFQWIAERRCTNNGNGFSLEFCCEGYLPRKTDRAVRNDPYFCRAGISIGSVLCDGAISACPNISRSLVQGNIRTDDFKKVWETKYLPFRDREWMKQGDCTDCKQWKHCLGNSMHLWDDEQKRTVRCFKDICVTPYSGCHKYVPNRK